MKKYLACISVTLILFSIISCSEDDLAYFQNNDPEPEYGLFNILDDYPALKSAFDPINQRRFNNLLGNSMNCKLAETKDILKLTDDLLLDTGHPVTDIIAYFRNILYQIINQHELDHEAFSDYKYYPRNYDRFADDFYDFYDVISDNNITFSDNVIPILQRSLNYIEDTYDNDELEEIMADLIDFLRDNKADIWRDNEDTLFEDSSKLLFQANENIWLNENGSLISNRNKISVEGVKNTGLGNAARGMDAFLSGINELLKDENIRENVYDILREVGNLVAATHQDKDINAVMKDYIKNIRKYLQKGGEEYDRVYESPEFNPYSANNERVYSDAGLEKLTEEMIPGVTALLLRSDREGSLLNDNKGAKNFYFLDDVSKLMRSINFTPDNPASSAAHIEESIYDLMRFDGYGRDRVVSSYNAETFNLQQEPSPVGSLEHILHLAAGAITPGWPDAETDELDGLDPNSGHGHGECWGLLTMNDVLFSLGTNRVLGMLNLYEMAFSEDVGNHIFRSMNYFEPAVKENFKFHFDQNFSVFSFLCGRLATDYGIPEGGNPEGKDDYGKLNTYMPYNGLGVGQTDLAQWLLGTLVRSCWRGEGPYYAKENMKKDGNVYTYFRPDGRIYATITKPDPNDPATWEYFYPVDKGDVATVAQFISDIDLLSDDGVILSDSAIIEITIDGKRKEITFDSGLWGQNEVVDKINEAFAGDFEKDRVWPAGKGFIIKGENKDPGAGIIHISNVTGNGLSQLFLSEGNLAKRDGTIKEYAGRENRYYDRWNSDYYMISYRPFLGSKDKICTPENLSGTANGPGSVVVSELIPEFSRDRECDTFEESIYRNWIWFFTEMKITLPLTLYATITGEAFKEFIKLLGNELNINIPGYVLNPIEDLSLIALPVFLLLDANGAMGLVLCKKVPTINEIHGNRRWAKDGGHGLSDIPGDYRLDVRLAEELLTRNLKLPLGLTIDLQGFLENATGKMSNLFIDLLYNGVLLGTPIQPPVLKEGRPILPSIGHQLLPLCRMAFPRSTAEQVYPETSSSLSYGDLMIGSRKGDLRTKSCYGFEASDDDPNWKGRNAFLPLFTALLATSHQYEEYDPSRFNPLIPGSGIMKNGIQTQLDGIFSFLVRPSIQYFEKDHPDSLHPHNTWKTTIVGGALVDNHNYGDRYIQKGTNDNPDTTGYFLTRNDDVADADSESPYGGWGERNFYRKPDIVNLFNILSDSNPFAAQPERCDGMLPIVLAYDTSNATQDPNNVTNTRLLSKIIKFLYYIGDAKYDDPPDYNDNDYTTWGTRRKICYGIEQLVTCIKTRKGFVTDLNSKNYKNMIRPDWMFTHDYEGNPLNVRPEDISFNVGGFPGEPGQENWENFDKLTDALSELLSNKGKSGGKYNIMEETIALMDKIFTRVDLSEENIRGLRHTMGSVLVRYNNTDSTWEYPDDLIHIFESELPELLEVFQGHYSSLLVLADALMKTKGNDEAFLLYLLKNLKSAYPTQDVVEQLHDFLGTDIIKRHDSALWADMAELLSAFVEMIDDEEQPGWLEDDTFISNKVMEDSDPYRAVGELLSW